MPPQGGGIYVTSFLFRVASVVQPSASLPAPYAPRRGATPNPEGVRCNAYMHIRYAYTFNARVRVYVYAYNFGLFLHVLSHFLRQGAPSGQ